jgi:hypothetical protein
VAGDRGSGPSASNRLGNRSTPRDAVSIIAAVVTLAVTALFAAWIPARRAAAVDPIRALRVE